MRTTGLLAGLLLGLTALTGCKRQLSEREVRRIVRQELQQELDARERRRAKAARSPDPLVPPGKAGIAPPPRRPADTPSRSAERLERRIATLERLLARFRKIPSVKRERIALMEKQLDEMRRRLTALKGSATAPLAPGPGAPPPAAGLTQAAWHAALDKGIARKGPLRYEVRRSLLTLALQNVALVSRDFQVRPFTLGSRLTGFRLGEVAPRGALARLGLKRGDVLTRVDGQPIGSPDKMLAVFARLRRASKLVIGFRRGARSLTLTVDLR